MVDHLWSEYSRRIVPTRFSRALRAVGITLVLSGWAAPMAQALDAPEILYREGVSEYEPAGPWLPLDGARINGLGFILGTRTQAKPPGDSAVYYRLSALSVPDGHPDQGSAFDPAQICISRAGPPGEETVLAIGRYEGPGSYLIRLDADLPSNGATHRSCSGGPSSTATFTIDPAVTLELRSTATFLLGGDPFRELATIPSLPLGGAGHTQCARDARMQPDGSLAGAQVTQAAGSSVLLKSIPRAGRWTCVGRARSTAGGTDGEHFTRWSSPVSFLAREPFSTTLAVPDKRPPRVTLVFGRMPAGAVGGRVSLRIRPGARCPRVASRTLLARVDSRRRARFSFRLPERDKAELEHGRGGVDSYGWNFRLAFAGTTLVPPARDAFGAFVYPKRHLYGHTLGFPGLDTAYCVRTG